MQGSCHRRSNRAFGGEKRRSFARRRVAYLRRKVSCPPDLWTTLHGRVPTKAMRRHVCTTTTGVVREATQVVMRKLGLKSGPWAQEATIFFFSTESLALSPEPAPILSPSSSPIPIYAQLHPASSVAISVPALSAYVECLSATSAPSRPGPIALWANLGTSNHNSPFRPYQRSS